MKLSKLKSVDFYKKLPMDLTEATLPGAWISIVAAVLMAFLFGMEFYSFMTLKTSTQLIVDRSPPDELLKVNFNISFPSLSCEFATLDISDALGTKRLNLTKTVKKTPINLEMERQGAAVDETNLPVPKYDEDGALGDSLPDLETKPLSHDLFTQMLDHYPILVVNFYAPWCHWCQKLAPTWEAASLEVHEKYPEEDRRIRFAKVDCVVEAEMCRANIITGFPSIRVFRKGHDDIIVGRAHLHESYTGDRTKESLVAFADSLVPSAGERHAPPGRHAQLTQAPKSSGCNLSGFALVKKVPGTLHFAARSAGHSFDHTWLNMTHVVHAFYLGSRPTMKKYRKLVKLHPAGLQHDWADKLYGQNFTSESAQSTHEHYLQIVLTTIEPSDHAGEKYDAYEYTVHSHTFETDNIPSARFTYDLSPIQILVNVVWEPWYHFFTTTCAIIGGVFTVAGIVDSMLYTSLNALKKAQLGKNT